MASSIKPAVDQDLHNNSAIKFDPSIHLAYESPSRIISMKELGFPEDIGISPVAVCQPFRLFSHDAIHHMRDEILSKNVMENCSVQSNIAACQLRDYAARYAPFVYEAWNHPETLRMISEIAGVDLVPCMDLEIGHANISIKSDEQTQEELKTLQAGSATDSKDDKPAVGWHTDSYPFVCVLMLSDSTNMVGGETALRTGHGDILKVRGPEMGCATVMQGRYIHHQALRALGGQERITMVTSFRPKSPHLPDDANLATVRPISDLSELYYQFSEYRLEIIEQRIRHELRNLRKRHQMGRKFDTDSFKKYLSLQEKFLAATNRELVENHKVTAGWIEEISFDDDESAATAKQSISSKI